MLAKYGDNVAIRESDKLGDLGYSILKAIEGLQGEGIINFGDTIINEPLRMDLIDFFYASEDSLSDIWTFFEEKDGVITSVLDKEKTNIGRIGKLFVGVFKVSNLEYLSECLLEALSEPEEHIDSFYMAIKEYSKKYPFHVLQTDKWLDIGHQDKYYHSTLEVKAREFNYISIDKDRGILKKKSDDRDKFIGEIKWYLKLPSDVEYVCPRLFGFSTSYENPYVFMEYYAYHTIHELYLYGDLTSNQWYDIFKRIRFVCDDFKRYTVKDARIVDALEEMYLNKTLQRFDMLRDDKRFHAFFERSICVNENRYISLNRVVQKLRENIPKMLYDIDVFNIIHGDLCFSNIMIDSNLTFIKVIDPRGRFGQFDIYGDPRYELAKLFHSVDGKYDYIIKDLFEMTYSFENLTIKYQILEQKRDYDICHIFKEVFQKEIGKNESKIELIEALLFLSMIPLHKESLNHQMVMLATGLDVLNRVINILER
ncbi:MAG: aminoglycoside phosphotransferase family protein [Clostridium sp.]|nr:aminoglycoside phosphotransferase family protein [Clostridium sp.]